MKVLKNFAQTSADICKLSGGKFERANRLLEKAQFMDAEMLKLQRLLKQNGWTEQYMNGANQFGVKKSSYAETYISLSKNYLAIMKQLDEMLSSVTSDDTDSKLSMFIDE